MTVEINMKSFIICVALFFLGIFWALGTTILLIAHGVFLSLFFYMSGVIVAFILLNLEYKWVRIK